MTEATQLSSRSVLHCFCVWRRTFDLVFQQHIMEGLLYPLLLSQ